MGFGKKKYIGGFRNQDEAARTYDKHSIIAQGIKAKTNFDYTARELL